MSCLTTWAHSCSAVVLLMRTMSTPKGLHKQSHGCSCQGSKATNHTLRTLRKLHPEPTPAHTGSLRNLPEPASGTCTSTHRNPPEPSGTCLRNLHQHTPEPSGTFRNLPPEPTPAHTGTLRNLPEPASRTYTSPPEPSGTCLRNLHQHTPEPSPPEPTPAHTGTLRNLLEPSSGTCSCDPHRHTPELIWAEDPISLRCWGKNDRTWSDCNLNDLNMKIHGVLPA